MSALVLTVVLLASSGLGFGLAQWVDSVLVGIFVGSALSAWYALLLLLVTPMAMWGEQYRKVKDYEEPRLDIFYDNDNDSCRRDFFDPDSGYVQVLFRVGVQGAKGVNTKGVIVRVESAEPAITDLPQRLHPMSAKRVGGADGHWEGDGAFDIRPGEVEYVDVFRFETDLNSEGSLSLVANSFSMSIPDESYSLIIKAAAMDERSVTKRFRLESEKGGIPGYSECTA